MRISILLFAAVVLVCCRQSSSGVGKLTLTDSLRNYLKVKVGPLLDNQESDAARHILDSVSALPSLSDEVRFSIAVYQSTMMLVEYKYDSARYYAGQMEAIYPRFAADSGNELLSVRTQLTSIYVLENNWDSAMFYGHQAYYLSKKYDPSVLPKLCYRLAEISSALRDYSSQYKYLLEGKAMSDSIPMFKLAFGMSLAVYHGDKGNVDSGIYYYNTIKDNDALTHDNVKAVKYANLGLLYMDKGMYKEGLALLLKSIPYDKAAGSFNGESMFNLGRAYSLVHNYDSSNYYLDMAYRTAVSAGERNWQRLVCQQRSQNYRAQRQMDAAVAALDSVNQLLLWQTDSSLAFKAREMEVKYSVRQKDDRLSALAFRNQANEKISIQRKQIIIFLVIAILLAGMVVVLWWRRRKTEMEVREIALRQQWLRTQMDPHFLFNMLSVLKGLIADDPDKANVYVGHFANLMRKSLSNSQERFVALTDEISALESYLSILRMSYDEVFTYDFQLYEEYGHDGVLIPPMIIQPFVENAVLHGVSGGGHITVRVEKRKGTLRCVIEDSGRGLQGQRQQGGHVSRSTEITTDRLRILGKQTGIAGAVHIADRKDTSGVVVLLDVPYLIDE